MVTPYVDDVSGWKAWQTEYRFGVLLVVPPDPPLSVVDALRAEHDPKSHAACGAHISLTVPLQMPLTDSHWDELSAIAAGVHPFDIRCGPAVSFPPHPGVCLAIEPQLRLDALRATLESASAFGGAPPRRYPFTAHMTIAEYLHPEQTQPLIDACNARAIGGTFVCDEVCLSAASARAPRRVSAHSHLTLIRS
jgi:2'-5' RNA ligase